MRKAEREKIAARERAHREALHEAFFRARYHTPASAISRGKGARKNPTRERLKARERALIQAADRRLRRRKHSAATVASHTARSRALARVSGLLTPRPKKRRKVARRNPPQRARKPVRKRRTRRTTMARRSAAQRAATKRMIAANRASRARRRSGGGAVVLVNPRRRARKRRRSRSLVVMANPRRRRRRAHMRHNPRVRRRHRRNPGMSAMVKTFAQVAVPSVLSGASFGLLDAKVLSANNLSQPIRYAAKAAYALALGFLFRKNPVLSASAMGGVLGGLGSDVAAQLGGGTPAAPTTTAAVKGIGALLREDPQAMGLLVQQMNGMGYVVDNNVSLGRMRGLASAGVGDDTESYDDVNLG